MITRRFFAREANAIFNTNMNNNIITIIITNMNRILNLLIFLEVDRPIRSFEFRDVTDLTG